MGEGKRSGASRRTLRRSLGTVLRKLRDDAASAGAGTRVDAGSYPDTSEEEQKDWLNVFDQKRFDRFAARVERAERGMGQWLERAEQVELDPGLEAAIRQLLDGEAEAGESREGPTA